MSVTTFHNGRVTLHAGDCLDILDTMPENSVDSCVCDPPYHLHSIVKRFAKTGRTESTTTTSGPHQRTATGFMGRTWDGGDIAFQAETWAKVLRVLKPGAYIIAFSSSRTFGRMSVALEDAGFITHPMIGWIFAQGFPKATRMNACALDGSFARIDTDGFRYGGQALKPALEPIYVGQKPFSEANGTANILRWGTGAVNIDGCRIGTNDDLRAGACQLWSHRREGQASADRRYSDNDSPDLVASPSPPGGSALGRWPANLVLSDDAEVIEAFPEAPGQQRFVGPQHGDRPSKGIYGDFGARPDSTPRADQGGSAARFFFQAKADAEDRLNSKHPTVKPLDLMRWLVRLVTPPRGLVLDPFAGTGTTAHAALIEGMRAILIEREPEYQADIARRMDLVFAGQDERKGKLAKAQPHDTMPLFGGAA